MMANLKHLSKKFSVWPSKTLMGIGSAIPMQAVFSSFPQSLVLTRQALYHLSHPWLPIHFFCLFVVVIVEEAFLRQCSVATLVTNILTAQSCYCLSFCVFGWAILWISTSPTAHSGLAVGPRCKGEWGRRGTMRNGQDGGCDDDRGQHKTI